LGEHGREFAVALAAPHDIDFDKPIAHFAKKTLLVQDSVEDFYGGNRGKGVVDKYVWKALDSDGEERSRQRVEVTFRMKQYECDKSYKNDFAGKHGAPGFRHQTKLHLVLVKRPNRSSCTKS
jgi:hypothetical protein